MAGMVSERVRSAVLEVFPKLKLSHRTLLRQIARNAEAGVSSELGELRSWGLVQILLRRHVRLTDVGEATIEYLNAYELAASDFPKGGGLLGGTARLLAAQAAGEAALAKAP